MSKRIWIYYGKVEMQKKYININESYKEEKTIEFFKYIHNTMLSCRY